MASEENERTPLLPMVQQRNGRLYVAAFSAVLGSFSFGYAMVFSSAVIPQLQEDDDPSLHMNVDQISWFGSDFAIGAIVGGVIAMKMNDYVGRKHSIMISAIPSTVGFILMAAASNLWFLLLGRLLTGIAAGIASSAIPVYVSEISHPRVRGFLGSSAQTMMVLGGLVLYALGLVLPWRWLAVAGIVPSLIMVTLLCFMPNSPRYLITNDRRVEAEKALEWLRGAGSNNTEELQQIKHSVESQVGMQWSDRNSRYLYKPILISVVMRFLQQMTGITPFLVYLEPIFEKTAVSLLPKYEAAIVGLFRLLPVIIISKCMDKTGRKPLLYASAFIMYAAMLIMSVYTLRTSCDSGNATMTETSEDVVGFDLRSGTVIPLISVILLVIGYSIGWGPITWLLMSEILPIRVRGIASGMCVVVSYITAFVLTEFFMQAVAAYGLWAPFLFFSVVCVVNIIFIAKCVPETKGRTLEEIENYFRTGHTFSIADG